MAVRRLAEDQPQSFEFTPDNLAWAKAKMADYPQGRQSSAVIPILWRAQEQMGGWLPEPAIRLVADMLDMPYIRVFEIATFYTMFQLKPVGTVAHIGVCGTTPCMLRGAQELIAICKDKIAARPFDLSDDGRFSWEEVECAGACVNAPMVQIGADTYEDLTPDTFNALLQALDAGTETTPGPQSGRRTSEPISGATSLTADAPKKAPKAPPTAKPAKTNGAGATPPAAPKEPAAPPATAAPASDAADDAPDSAAIARANAAGTQPPSLTRETAGAIDDLQQISGIGKVIEKKLHDLGIFKFEQIAAWDESHKDWINAYLAFKGRIDRENWVEQARAQLDGDKG